MGSALAQAALDLGYEVIVVSGPVTVDYPQRAVVRWVVSTEELLERCREIFPSCGGMIAAAAPCDYRPVRVAEEKISKTGQPLELRLVETPDVAATLGAEKRSDQWTVGFALETEDQRFRALAKLERKCCDLIVLNGPDAMNSPQNHVEIIDPSGRVLRELQGDKEEVARGILQVIESHLEREF